MMSGRPHLRRLLSLPPIAAVLVVLTGAVRMHVVEDFSSRAYRDSANTTADWDTVTGVLHLPGVVPSLLGSFDTAGDAQSVTVSDTIAYIADLLSGLRIVNVRNPAAPVPLGTLDTPGSAYAVAVSGTVAYVADGTAGLQIVNVANPASPALLGTYNTPGSAQAVVVVGTLAYVADGASGLVIVNVTNPAAPTLVGSLDTPGSAMGVAISGTRAYIADLGSGLRILNVTTPATPTLLGSVDTPGNATGVAVLGNKAFVADGASGLQVINVSNPASPALMVNYDTPGSAVSVSLWGATAFVADLDAGLQVIDVRVPASPSLVMTLDTPNFARGLDVRGTNVYVADGTTGLRIIRAGAWGPHVLGSLPTVGSVTGIALSGSLAYFTDHLSGLQIADVSNPASPVLVGSLDTPGVASDVAVSGNRAYVADWMNGLRIIDVTNPASPVLLGVYPTPGGAASVAVSGNFAYVAEWTGGLRIINVTNPASPTLSATYPITEASCVEVRGTTAYVTGYVSGLWILNVTNPASPTFVDSVGVVALSPGLALAGTKAYVANGYNGLQIVDLNTNSIVKSINFYPATAVATSGGFVYTPSGALADVSHPAGASVVGFSITGGNSVAAAGSIVYLGTTTYGLLIADAAERVLDTSKNLARSLELTNYSWAPLARVRVGATDQRNVAITFLADLYGAQQSPGWTRIYQGNSVRWNAQLLWNKDGVTDVSTMEIEWLLEPAMIGSITDIANDQGRRVRLKILASGIEGYEIPAAGEVPITSYQVHHRVDDALAARVRAEGRSLTRDESIARGAGSFGAAARALGDRTFVLGDQKLAPSLDIGPVFPDGVWETVANVTAFQRDEYLVPITTDGDSTSEGISWSAFCVTTHTTDVTRWYVSEVDSAYSIDNLAPNVPAGFTADFEPGVGVDLAWQPSGAADFRYFRVYRSNAPGFVPGPGNLVHSTIGTAWTDPDLVGPVYYKLTAVDFAGNESPPASAGVTVGVPPAIPPARFALHRAAPNPFRGSVRMNFDVPAPGGRVVLGVYDVGGRLVRTLVDRDEPAGTRGVTWDARDGQGHSVPAGLYFVRMRAPGFGRVEKVLLTP